jgi:hypothetical protein
VIKKTPRRTGAQSHPHFPKRIAKSDDSELTWPHLVSRDTPHVGELERGLMIWPLYAVLIVLVLLIGDWHLFGASAGMNRA